MRVLPFLDLKGGQVVRGIAGRRSEYVPIRSPLTGATGKLLVDRGNLIQDYGPRSLVEIT